VAACGGFAILAESLLEPANAAMAPSLVAALMHALDDPAVRACIARQHGCETGGGEEAESRAAAPLLLRCLFAAYTGSAQAAGSGAEGKDAAREASRLAARWEAYLFTVICG
ncbi:unnamed protein product, partial [Polarella glacialis]